MIRKPNRQEYINLASRPVQAVIRTSVISLVLAASLTFGLSATWAGTTYYVSQSSGNDGRDGLAPNGDGTHGPWKTLGRASQTYSPGDRVLLKCGDTWSNDTLRPKGSGTPDNPITIASYGSGAKPVLDGLDDTQDRVGIHLVDEAGYQILGLEFTRYRSGIFAHYSAGKEPKSYLWIEDCYFHDSTYYCKYHDYLKNKPGLGVILWTDETKQRIVVSGITLKNCRFERLLSAIWTNNPDNFNMNAGGIYNFGNLVVEGCTTEEGMQWQLGLRGVDGGAVRNCVFHDTGRGFQSFNGVAGAMIQRSRNLTFEDSEWGFVSIGDPGKVSGDGQSFDFEEDCSRMTMKNCLFHDTDGPGFLLCYGASGYTPHRDIVLENCVLNGKAMRVAENGFPKIEIFNASDKNRVDWKNCRFYLSPGERLTNQRGQMKFTDCLVKKLSKACSTPNLVVTATSSASSNEPGHEAAKAIDGSVSTSWKSTSSADTWLQLDFRSPQTINEFRIKEHPSSSIIRYVIECWDSMTSRWVGCFNGRTIGPDFVAPIVGRTTTKVRLLIKRTTGSNPCIAEFEVYNDTTPGPPDRTPAGPPPLGVVNDSHDHIIYSDDWVTYSSASEIGGDENYSNAKGASCQLTFQGTGITWIGVKNLDNGEAEVYLDGALQATIDTYNATRLSQQKLFIKTGLPHGTHTIKIVVKGTKNAASMDCHVIIDAFKVENFYQGMPATDTIFGWIEDLWKFGADSKYGWRMPGTPADHQAAEYLLEKFKAFGLEKCEKELVTVPACFPKTWRLTVNVDGVQKEIPCSYVHYAASTPDEGITAELVYVNRGSEKDFETAQKSVGVAGKIVVVDIPSGRTSWNDWFRNASFVYDPDQSLPGSAFIENWPDAGLFGTAIRNASRYGGIACIGILVDTPKDNSLYYHGPRHDAPRMPCLNISPASGQYLRDLLKQKPIHARLILTNTGQQRWDRGTFHGIWGATYDIEGFLAGKSDEVIVIMSHHDGGAVNEASGAASVMALAKYFAQFPKESRNRTLMFFLIGSHFGQRPPTLDQARTLDALKEKVVGVVNIEMIGKEYTVQDGKYVETGRISPVNFGLTQKNSRLVSIISEAIKKHDLRRSAITDRYVGEAHMMGARAGFPSIERLAMHAPEFNLFDTPETVAKEALRPTACAFVDIIQSLDSMPAEDIGRNPFRSATKSSADRKRTVK